MEDSRNSLLDFYRTQMNSSAEIIMTTTIGLAFQGIVFVQAQIFEAAIFFSITLLTLIFFMFLKLWWNAYLWNAALITQPANKLASMREVLKQYPPLNNEWYKSTEIFLLHAGSLRICQKRIINWTLPKINIKIGKILFFLFESAFRTSSFVVCPLCGIIATTIYLLFKQCFENLWLSILTSTFVLWGSFLASFVILLCIAYWVWKNRTKWYEIEERQRHL